MVKKYIKRLLVNSGKSLVKTLFQFGSDAFPVWISRFTGIDEKMPDLGHVLWTPLTTIPYDHEELELWTITESFCYKNSPLGYSQALTTTQKDYFIAFSDALRYKISLPFKR